VSVDRSFFFVKGHPHALELLGRGRTALISREATAAYLRPFFGIAHPAWNRRNGIR
jgi:hypothetical protein